ncbi:bifunctional adenosylcobinamide kinase/adenosylcobinamide-phosphate guanylyltransferase [Gloeocapsa sp. PCC 73106]|uniref:bifunctional adenosylcobinamide kinase/adenosylcobinamide-phosphate guanylyltransferase n=1 Tax=Gloeocapsa sp. PCC 73106 TaxID=102232 RepID=UPI0002ACF271|nr:bifunctional adenosylcobinamide kinase/adenosylcobinamide-phosphate guanylyltransferase [Gloeocapsa sp. PCC 73106]ELR98488.1 adenosyl cobinamide kinase/adenosyl cobinamide phosphate guanylyltransferase [Gloeocapsa sp. PCC 73106]
MPTISVDNSEIILITGPARSGKSEWAETLAQEQDLPIVYVATAVMTTDDLEWCQRIELHRQRRPESWETWEVPVDLTQVIRRVNPPHCLLIDSVGTWVANLLSQDDESWGQTQTELLTALKESPLKIILVAEETGWGLVPAYPLGRQFRDRLGTLVRHLGQVANTVYLVTAGHVLNLTELGTSV